MLDINVIQAPMTVKQLKEFGLVTAAIFVGLFALLLPWLFSHATPNWPFIVAGVLVVWALVFPATLIYLYRPWMRVGLVLGYVNAHILLGIIFFIIVTPIGFLLKLFGKTAIKPLESTQTSYRIESQIPDASHMENPY